MAQPLERLEPTGPAVDHHRWASGCPRSRERARTAVHGWRPGTGFPYDEVLDHYRAVGRNQADVTICRSAEAGAAASGWPLAQWLPMTLDAGIGGYDSYLGSALFEDLPGVEPAGSERTCAVTDTLVVALLADLCRTEIRHWETAGDSPARGARVRAVVHALQAAAGFAPASRVLPEGISGSALPDLAATGRRAAAEVLVACPSSVRFAVDLSLLPTTTVHDEIMFVRTIQAFECVYRQVAGRLRAASGAAGRGEVGDAMAALQDATARLDATKALYRVVTTISKDAFAVIRGATDGRSAIQSRAYAEVEQLAAGPAAPLRDHTNTGICSAAEDLGRAWVSMKRTHWGIALKVIGRVRGTGGTEGADYLEQKAVQPLFPQTGRTAGAGCPV
ncbi:hypothetical protein GIS00_17175 [Nakamurella sp. YIM 132087]|uniref:Tryptophan 2,3-dioxygenase n=1 Tax=Nakamurella alba TaxID=2665158 RepID=A0A7K1FNG2_9ACTN|nr:hypothetical protein [Nakamurella alba]MTD15668.1 hypothetical protein [Nakamurella alba]